jgi:hypothetical protein
MKSRRLIYLLLVTVLAINLPPIARQYRPFRTEKDLVTQHADHLVPALKVLPASGLIGYMCDPREELDGTADNTPYATNALPNHDVLLEFVIWQYILAPRILVNTTDVAPIIGNLHLPLPLPALQSKRLRIESQYPSGLCILKKEE